MEPILVVSTLVLIFAPVHFYLRQEDLVTLRQWIGWGTSLEDCQEDPVTKEFRVEEEMMKVRQMNLKMLCRLFAHIVVPFGIAIFYQALSAPEFDTMALGMLFLVAYCFHSVVGSSMELTARHLTIFNCVAHVLVLPCSFLPVLSATSSIMFPLAQSFVVALRFCAALYFFDQRLIIPFNIAYSSINIIVYVCHFRESGGANLFLLLSMECFNFVLILATGSFIDLALRRQTYAVLDTAHAESLLVGFRKMLRGICDGEALLDSHMNVAQESECLKHLILTTVSLEGRSFEELLLETERPRFRHFIQSSASSSSASSGAPPFCSRLLFRGAAGIGVAADVYHVPIWGLFGGATQPHHLIAFKEDPELRQHPEAEEDSLPAQLRWKKDHPHASASSARTASLISGSTVHSAHPIFPEFQEMTLLVDVETELQDILQAHLSFERTDQSEPAVSSSMPSLRRLVKPTDWEPLRASVVAYVEQAQVDPDTPPLPLAGLSFQLPSQSGWLQAEEATLHRIQGAQKVWFHLKTFRPEKVPRPRSSLDAIHESPGLRGRSEKAGGTPVLGETAERSAAGGIAGVQDHRKR
ncbi:Reverse transcriptase domain-containing protein [Durusdinium trenchii]|uniref:Reverse transcriptase domain-containing protein n=1 Tax=Durusdinium trenchii TaxID=1381693 RepID=A0ABP0IYG5_9DINO